MKDKNEYYSTNGALDNHLHFRQVKTGELSPNLNLWSNQALDPELGRSNIVSRYIVGICFLIQLKFYW